SPGSYFISASALTFPRDDWTSQCAGWPCHGLRDRQIDVGVLVLPLPFLPLEFSGLVHDDLRIDRVDVDRVPLQRPGSRPFKVHPVETESGTMTRALDLPLAEKHIRSAPQM